MNRLKFDEKGLIPVICQHATTKQVLMFAYAKKENIEKTLKTGVATFYSRSRDEEWVKGLTSGNTQQVIEILVDCDMDTLIYMVNPDGPACHTGAYSCFFKKINKEGEVVQNE